MKDLPPIIMKIKYKSRIRDFDKIFSDLKKIDPNLAHDDQDSAIVDISLKYSICWNTIMKIIDLGIIEFDEEAFCLTINPNIQFKSSSDYQI